MKQIVLKFCCLVAFVFAFQANAQESFPDTWEGNYKGELQIFGVDSVQMKLTMKLAIHKKRDSVYQWKMTYDFQGKEDVRDYELKIVDKLKGHYVIDELNSIVIDGFYKMETFTSFFEVMDSYIISTYTKVDNSLMFEIIAANGKNPTKSGNQKFNNNDIPEVKTYLVNGRQKAMLKKY